MEFRPPSRGFQVQHYMPDDYDFEPDYPVHPAAGMHSHNMRPPQPYLNQGRPTGPYPPVKESNGMATMGTRDCRPPVGGLRTKITPCKRDVRQNSPNLRGGPPPEVAASPLGTTTAKPAAARPPSQVTSILRQAGSFQEGSPGISPSGGQAGEARSGRPHPNKGPTDPRLHARPVRDSPSPGGAAGATAPPLPNGPPPAVTRQKPLNPEGEGGGSSRAGPPLPAGRPPAAAAGERGDNSPTRGAKPGAEAGPRANGACLADGGGGGGGGSPLGAGPEQQAGNNNNSSSSRKRKASPPMGRSNSGVVDAVEERAKANAQQHGGESNSIQTGVENAAEIVPKRVKLESQATEKLPPSRQLEGQDCVTTVTTVCVVRPREEPELSQLQQKPSLDLNRHPSQQLLSPSSQEEGKQKFQIRSGAGDSEASGGSTRLQTTVAGPSANSRPLKIEEGTNPDDDEQLLLKLAQVMVERRVRINKFDAEKAVLDDRLAEKDRQIGAFCLDKIELEAQLSQRNREVEKLNAEVVALKKALAKRDEEIEGSGDLKKSLVEKDEQIKDLKSRLASKEQGFLDLKAALDEQNSTIEKCRKENVKLQGVLKEKDEFIQGYRGDIEKRDDVIAQKEKECAALQAKAAEKNRQVQSLEKENALLKERLQRETEQCKELAKQLDAEKQAKEKVRQDCNQLWATLEQNRATLDHLFSQRDNKA